jgi:hypothetical protein
MPETLASSLPGATAPDLAVGHGHVVLDHLRLEEAAGPQIVQLAG